MNWLKVPSGHSVSEQTSVTVNVESTESLLTDIRNNLKRGQGFSVATLNLDHVVKLRRFPDFRKAYMRHTYITADGRPIIWLLRLAGQKIKLVPGSELIDPVCNMAASQNIPVAFFGSTVASLEKAGSILSKRHPGIRIVAKIAPPMGFDAQSAGADIFIEEIRKSGARICFLALGAPRQEEFAIRASEQLPEIGFLSIGAGLDFISGLQVRAPKIMQAFGTEWLWRLITKPRLFAKRYWQCTLLLPGLAQSAWRARDSHSPP